jgi:phosphoribosylformylglycinamidine synthase I
MHVKDIRVCVLRVGGTNCDAETKRSFEELGAKTEILLANEIVRRRNLFEYDALVFPGGFSYGDYVRAGAIWAKWILTKLGKELQAFVDEGRPVLGICNGFQVLVEAGLLPAFDGASRYPDASLATNVPPSYNCRWIHLKNESNGKCVFTLAIPKGKILSMPVAHSEGRFIFSKDKEERFLERLRENDQLVFRYCNEKGEYADGDFPTNPNGSFYDIAGICNPEGTVFGLMPHPERAFYWWQQPDWTRHVRKTEYCDCRAIFESLIVFLSKRT